MGQFAKDLKAYADNGLRTADDWMSLGRQVNEGTAARSSATWRGQSFDLFSRDQTHKRQPRVARTK